MTRHGWIRATAIGLVTLAGLPASRAQVAGSAECRSAATDSLAAARRARSAVADRAAYQGRVDARFAAMGAGDAEYAVDDGAVIQGLFVDQTNAVEGYRLCGAAGGDAAELTGGWTGIGVEWRTTDDQWMVALSLVSGGDSLSPSAFVADDDNPVSPDAVGYGYLFWLVEARLTDWLQLGYGGISDAEVRMSLGEDASGATASNSQYTGTGEPGRHYVQLGVPRLSLTAGLVAGEVIDFGEVAIGPLPVPHAAGLELGGAVRRLGDEDLVATGIEGAWPLLDGTVRPSLELDLAWPDARLRVARLRVQGGLQGTGRFMRDMPTTLGWGHAGVAAFVEASRFDSAAVERAGGDAALGYAAGIAGRIGARAGELEISGFAARNRVETLERLPDASDRLEYGLGLLLRIGW